MRRQPRRGRQLLSGHDEAGAGGVAHRAAVLGSPIAHSLSPSLHRAAYAALGLTGWDYGRHELQAAGLPAFVAGLDTTWRGLSLTMPLKEAALEVASSVSPLAVEAGAANTLVRTPDGWAADNTDVHGIVAAVTDALADQRPETATVIGSGATARSALLALRELGIRQVRVAARNAAAVRTLAELAGVQVLPVPLQAWADERSDVVVATLPAGAADALATPAAQALRSTDGSADLTGTVLLDVVYAGWPTHLADAAGQRGARVVSGLEMLVHQAARQHELFTGTPAPLAAMQAAGRAALGQQPDS